MQRIAWDETFSVHVKEIDEQHKKWIEIINRLHETLMRPRGDDLVRITRQTFNDMEEYVRFHFSFEEEYMRSIGYPGLATHTREHDIFLARIKQYKQDLQEGELILNSEIMKILINWLQSHILDQDKQYAAFAVRDRNAS